MNHILIYNGEVNMEYRIPDLIISYSICSPTIDDQAQSIEFYPKIWIPKNSTPDVQKSGFPDPIDYMRIYSAENQVQLFGFVWYYTRELFSHILMVLS